MDVQTKLKWGKNSYTIVIHQGTSAIDLKSHVKTLTGLEPHRQKLLCPKLWKGPLKDTDDVSALIKALSKGSYKPLVVTIIGSTETLEEKPADDRPRFLEDMTSSEIKQLELSQYQDQDGEETEVVDIVALQKEPGLERHDGKIGMYEYNRLVTGLPQHQINDILAKRKKSSAETGEDNSDGSKLNDMLAMTMGMELRRAYINSLAVLDSGTIVSGLDDGHVQLWKRCQMISDLRHAGGCVDHVRKFLSSVASDPAFITAGGGAISIWTEEGNRVMDIGSVQGTTPGSITTGSIECHGSMKYLASCFRITRAVDPNQFRLVPQNEHERRRRAEAEARESLIQNELFRVSCCIQVWFYDTSKPFSGTLQDRRIENDTAVVQVEDMNGSLVCGDKRGCITKFVWVDGPNQAAFLPQEETRLQIVGCQCSIVTLKSIQGNIVAVSLAQRESESNEEDHSLPSTITQLNVSISMGVLLVDMESKTLKAILNAHVDVVRCICPLPDGSILTTGGKNDARVYLWENNNITNAINAEEAVELKVATQMKEPGYVFDLQVLCDSDPTSNVFAIAGARYNVIKIVI